MTKKDYELIAETIATVETNIGNGAGWSKAERDGAAIALLAVARRLADEFKKQNERFDRQRFLVAANQDQ